MKTILFVDDHEVLARLSCEILEMQGYRAQHAYSAAEALQKIGSGDFDLLVTDFRMEGMDGLELARRVHSTHPHIPVIIVTGYGPLQDTKEVSAVLLKEDGLFPSLLDHIRTVLSQAKSDAAEAEEVQRTT